MKLVALFFSFLATVAGSAFVEEPHVDIERQVEVKEEDQPVRTLTRAKRKHVLGNNRIIGGVLANEQEFPFFVQGDGCGASLVWDDMVLTAAHCEGVFNDRVLVGAQQRNKEVNGAEWMKVLSPMKVHPSYSRKTDAWYVSSFLQCSFINPLQLLLRAHLVNSSCFLGT
jgi:hypothetical protein